jgi:hypothetical protein
MISDLQRALYQLRPTISAPEMGHADDHGVSRYRGHLTFVPRQAPGRDAGLWVAWVEYERADYPGVFRALITKQQTTLDHALCQLNDRLREKMRGGRKGRCYLPLDPMLDSGELSSEQVEARLAFIGFMQETFDDAA